MTTPVCGIGGGDRDPVATASPRGRVRHRPDRALGVRFVALRRGGFPGRGVLPFPTIASCSLSPVPVLATAGIGAKENAYRQHGHGSGSSRTPRAYIGKEEPLSQQPRNTTVSLAKGEAALDGFRAAAIDGIDRDEAKAHEALLVDLVAQLRGANALDAIGLKRPVTAKYLRVLYGAAQAAIDELPNAAA